MPDFNPYAIPDDDVNSLLHGSSTKTETSTAGFATKRNHALDGKTPCSTCNGIVHNIVSSETIPSEILDSLSEFLDESNEEVCESSMLLARSSPERTKVVADIINVVKNIHKVATDGPLLRAVAEVVNEMSGGKVELRWRVYQSERELIINHNLLKTINSMLQIIEGKAGTVDQGADDHTLVAVLHSMVNDILQALATATERYRLRAGEASIEPDQSVIDAGVYSNDRPRSRFTDHTMSESVQQELDVPDIYY